ncbi:MFS multidrug transporter [Aspergillus luchuensis]|uniref:MFS multidrug transporter n=1 Tax=Aspergillus kawachii TaxID=1069201 RepID=A0A146FQW0_ASPKA|nr:MFS multidrug transporter [Aspergillus luchuensis]
MSTILSALSLFISLWVMGFLGTWDCTSLDGSTQLLTEVLDDMARLPGTWNVGLADLHWHSPSH